MQTDKKGNDERQSVILYADDNAICLEVGVKILIASGYAKDRQIKEMMEQGCCGFIQKPFSINALSQKIMNI